MAASNLENTRAPISIAERRTRHVEWAMPDCTEVLAALEQARRRMVDLLRRQIEISPGELTRIENATSEIASLATGVREYARQEGPAGSSYEPLAADYVRMAVQSALEAMHRGDLPAARRRAEIASWAARNSSEESLSWVVAILLDLTGPADTSERVS